MRDRKFVISSSSAQTQTHSWQSGVRQYLLGDLSNRGDGGAVQVFVVLARFDEQVVLDVSLHLLAARYEVVVTPVHFVVTSRSSCIWQSLMFYSHYKWYKYRVLF
jgi:hypothetical protein